MKCTVFNGSPRGEKSNSSAIVRWMLESAVKYPSVCTEEVYLRRTERHDEYAAKMMESDISLIVFPLYTDSMPGITAAFFERLQPYLGKMAGRKIGFVIHSGFSEAHHSRFVEKYAAWLTRALNADYMGTVIYPGSESTRLMPDNMQKKKKELFNRIGESMLRDGAFDSAAVKLLVKTERLTVIERFLNRIAIKTGLSNFYWNSELKKNNAFENRFARPY